MMFSVRTRPASRIFLACAAALAAACAERPPDDRVRVSGQIEATDVQVAALAGGRLVERTVAEGDRVKSGDIVARVDAADSELALARARADRDQAEAQLRLVEAGSRPEDIRQAEAQLATAETEVRGADTEAAAAQTDVDRFESLLASNSGSRKQRDDAVARRDVLRVRVQAARDRVRAAREGLAKLRAGSRPEEVAAARARVAGATAQIAIWQKAIADASVTAPIDGVVSDVLADPGELLQPRAPILVVADMDHVWANVYVSEPVVPRLKLGQPATVFTDAGGAGLPGTITYISPKAEFTPRNVQTADDRSKLVYRVKVSVANPQGTLKVGMPIEAEIPFAAAAAK